MTEYHLVTSGHPDKEQLESLAFHMFDCIGRSLDASVIEDWDASAYYLVAALQSINELRAVLRQEDNK